MASVLFLLTACSEKTEEVKQPSTTSASEEKAETADKVVNDENQVQVSSEMEKEIAEASPAPENISELIHQYAGSFSGEGVNSETLKASFEKKVKEFEPLPENASNEELDQLFNYLYSLVAEDFPDPQSLIDKWELYSFGDPDLPDSRYQFKENYNIEIILDASGSMAQRVEGKTKMEIAKESIKGFLASAPKEANVSLRIYGHEGTNSVADKAKSCSSSELLYVSKAYDEAAFDQVLNQFNPSGWTPIAHSLKLAKEDMAAFNGETNTNLVFLVSDGIETCEGDPVAAAKELADSNISPIVQVIGFDVNVEGQKQMREVAEAADGIYTTANNQEELQAEFDRAKEILERWEDWKKKATSDAETKEVERSFEIIGFKNDWSSKKTNQGNNLSAFITNLSIEDVINSEQKRYLRDKEEALYEFVEKSRDELEADLENLNIETLEQTKKSIEEKYNQNMN